MQPPPASLPKEAADSDREVDAALVELVRDWYEAYRKAMMLFATISAGGLLVSTTFALKDSMPDPTARQAVGANLIYLEVTWALLLIAAVTSVAAIACAYKWYAAAMTNHLSRWPAHRLLDSFIYTPAASMRRWGAASAVFGAAAGFALLSGAVLFTMTAVRIIEGLYN